MMMMSFFNVNPPSVAALSAPSMSYFTMEYEKTPSLCQTFSPFPGDQADRLGGQKQPRRRRHEADRAGKASPCADGGFQRIHAAKRGDVSLAQALTHHA